MITFGPCKCCEQLRSERDFLRSLIRPKPVPNVDVFPIVTFEADQIISGADEQKTFSPHVKNDERQAEIDSEAARIFSGQY